MSLPRVSITFTKRQWAYLQAEARRIGVSNAEVVRRLIGEARAGFIDPGGRIAHRLSGNRSQRREDRA